MDRIVVGVDGSDGSKEALRWALRLAEQTGAVVEAVHAWEIPYGWIDGYGGYVQDWVRDAGEAAAKGLEGAIDEVLGHRPEYVEIIHTVEEGLPARVLMDRSKDADLLVVGSRGRGGFTELVMGSVSNQCVHHSTVPVVVVPPVV